MMDIEFNPIRHCRHVGSRDFVSSFGLVRYLAREVEKVPERASLGGSAYLIWNQNLPAAY